MDRDPFVDALAERIGSKPRAASPDAALGEAALAAPAPVAVLLRAIAECATPHVDLGWRSVWQPALRGFDLGLAHVMPGDAGWFDSERSLRLGPSGGGEVHFGVRWDERDVEWIEVDLEQRRVARYPSAEAFFRHVLADEQRRAKDARRKALPAELLAIFAAAGSPVAAPAPKPKKQKSPQGASTGPRFEPWKGDALDDPCEPAKSRFREKDYLVASERSPGGRIVVAQKMKRAPARPARIEVVSVDGSSMTVPIDPALDIWSVRLVPGAERALVSTGFPGPVLDVDITNGAARTLAEGTYFAASFVDDHHVALLGEGELCIHVLLRDGALKGPVSRLPMDGAYHVFAAYGRVFVKSRGAAEGTFHVARWDGASLTRSADAPTSKGKPGHWSEARRVGDAFALCCVDWQGAARWYRYVEPDDG